ncbi:MAG: DUF6398 domain-containing protein [Clostridium sp.]|uniref:DUF6398 domain-containing protein n=1 Tax=Clostridium sp. TaxID=1506 RepID=UPI00290E571D|nr:DUF6398 domain-containing protein [Clostridium sp.]MDU5111571.1 DUF6398 domain-containing protein [Clostridium sp.]
MQKTIELASNQRYLEIVSIIKEVCEDNLNKDYLFLAENLCKELFKAQIDALNKGKANSWACGIVHAIGLQNDLFNNKSNVRIKAQDFYKLFNVSSSTGLSKSKEVRSHVDMEEDKWLLSNINENIDKSTSEEAMDNNEVIDEVAIETIDNKEVNEVKEENNLVVEVDEDLKEANKIVKRALKEKNYNKKVKIAKEALRKSDKCSEAYIILSNDKTLKNEEKINLLNKAARFTEEVIGKDNISKLKSKDLNLDIVKAYIKVKYEIAKLLWSNNERNKAITELKLILKIDEKDELVVRGTLLTWLIIEDKDEEALDLISKYSSDSLIDIRFSKVLLLFKSNNLQDAERALRIANAYNENVIKYIIKLNRLPKDISDIKGNSKEEVAIRYYEKSKEAWDNINGLVSFIRDSRSRL